VVLMPIEGEVLLVRQELVGYGLKLSDLMSTLALQVHRLLLVSRVSQDPSSRRSRRPCGLYRSQELWFQIHRRRM
jgi:hypothetical protein